MFGGIGKKFSICGYPFYEFKSRKYKTGPGLSISHYSRIDVLPPPNIGALNLPSQRDIKFTKNFTLPQVFHAFC